jgi:hypothetical protein
VQDLREYLRAYRDYVAANVGWGKALGGALLWLAGLFAPLGARTVVQLPDWLPFAWMAAWSLGGYVFTPYGMWKYHRNQMTGARQSEGE